jgi:hypothetical protein
MFKWDFALSFAGKHREKAKRLAELLTSENVSVFYDENYKAQLWGKDLYCEFQRIYGKESRFFIPFVSAEYLEKEWPRHELRQAQARDIKTDTEYILPLRIDDTALPGLNETVCYVDLRTTTIEDVAELCLEKLAADLSPGQTRNDFPDKANTGGSRKNGHLIEVAKKTLAEFHSSLKTGDFFNMQLDDGALAVAVIPVQPASISIGIEHEDLFRQYLKPLWCTEWNHSRTGRTFRTFCLQEQNPTTATELGSNGTIEAANRELQIQGVRNSFDFKKSQNINVIPLWDIENVVAERIISYLALYREMEIQGPWYISISLLNLKPTVVAQRTQNYRLGNDRIFMGKDIVPDPIVIPETVDLSVRANVANPLKSIFDFIWMEFNFPASPHYDDAGNWIEE